MQVCVFVLCCLWKVMRPVRVHKQQSLHVSASFNPEVSNLPWATYWLQVTALRGERESDWREGVYSKQEQGLAGWLAITQECTQLPFPILFSVCVYVWPQTSTQQLIVSLTYSVCKLSAWCLHMTKLTTRVCVAGCWVYSMCLIKRVGRMPCIFPSVKEK